MDSNWLKEKLKGITTRVVSIDPGETSGVCVFEGPTLLDVRQLPTGKMPEAALVIEEYIRQWNPSAVVCEAYKVYAWKAKDHAWASLHTSRLIGSIEYMCFNLELPLTQQMAQVAKNFCTDAKLKAWNLWQPGQKHGRDAIRHCLYYLLFNVAKVHQPQNTNP